MRKLYNPMIEVPSQQEGAANDLESAIKNANQKPSSEPAALMESSDEATETDEAFG